jgi:hypothetical protein
MRAGSFGGNNVSRLLRLLILAYLPMAERHLSIGAGPACGAGSPERHRTSSLLA